MVKRKKNKPVPKSQGPKSQGTDPRVQKSRDAVLGVTSELLAETGFSGVSVDEVSRRSGVAKTTIYRHWPTRTALLLDACAKMGGPLEIPDKGSLEADLAVLIPVIANRLKTARWPTVLPSIIDAAERDIEIAELHARLHVARVQPIRTVIERAIHKGELPKDTNVGLLVARVLGPLFYRRWFSHEPLDSAFANSVVQDTLQSKVPKLR